MIVWSPFRRTVIEQWNNQIDAFNECVAEWALFFQWKKKKLASGVVKSGAFNFFVGILMKKKQIAELSMSCEECKITLIHA